MQNFLRLPTVCERPLHLQRRLFSPQSNKALRSRSEACSLIRHVGELLLLARLGPSVTSALRSLWDCKRTLRKALSTSAKAVLGEFQARRRAAENRIKLRRRLLAHTL